MGWIQGERWEDGSPAQRGNCPPMVPDSSCSLPSVASGLPTPSSSLLPSAGLWGPGVDPGRLGTGAHASHPGLGDVRVCVLLRGHHCPAHPVHNRRPRRGGFLGHPGECQLLMSGGEQCCTPSSGRLPRRHSKAKLARPSALSCPGGQGAAGGVCAHCRLCFLLCDCLVHGTSIPAPPPCQVPTGPCHPPVGLVSIWSWGLLLAAQCEMLTAQLPVTPSKAGSPERQ